RPLSSTLCPYTTLFRSAVYAVGRRDELPRRRNRHGGSDSLGGVAWAAELHPRLRLHRGERWLRHAVRAHRQLHQWRVVGAPYGRFLGDDLPFRSLRPAAPPKSALRGTA